MPPASADRKGDVMEKIILDCDPGHDDAIAILLAAANPAIDLLGITTVSGNHNVENTTRNALATCTAYGIKVPVAKGSPGPLIAEQVLAVEIHGETGLDGPVLPPASFDLDTRHGVDFIIETVMAHEPKSVTLVPVGPYTNIALAARKEPRIVERVKRVVAMGGSISHFILDIWEFIDTTHGGLLQIPYPAVHDACCVAALIDPTVFTTEKADIRVETEGRWTKGMTVCNFEKMGGMRHFGGTAMEQQNFRHTVAMTLDHPKFCDLIVDSVERLTGAKR
jgi:purine nucleosidase